MQKLNIKPLRKAETKNDIITVLEFWGVITLALIFATLLGV
jgi:succinate-acetate transporter protein